MVNEVEIAVIVARRDCAKTPAQTPNHATAADNGRRGLALIRHKSAASFK
jgi:hypothetical protein